MDDEFQSRPPFSIDWKRQYDCGPSDEHLHAIGQFIANYSMVEWKLAMIFTLFTKLNHIDSQTFIAELQLSQSGITRYIKKQCESSKDYDPQALKDMSFVLSKFSDLTTFRNQIVHWHWGLNEGRTATITDLIKPRQPGKIVEVSLEDIRDKCEDLIRVFQSLAHNVMIIQEPSCRAVILRTRAGTSHEKLFRASRT